MRSDIRLVLRNVLLASLAAGSAGCGDTTTDPEDEEIDVDGFDALACDPMIGPDAVTDLQATGAYDYVELRLQSEVDATAAPEIIQSAGVKCASATDAAACEQAIADAATTEGFVLGQCVQFCERYHYVLNQGDDVQVVDTEEGVLALIGDIDLPSEAVLRVELDGYRVACEDLERGGVRAVADGFEVIATKLTQDCDPVERTRYRLGVTTAGAVSELESEVYSSDKGSCIGRRPSCMESRRATGRSELGAYFGSVAHLEEAAVHAFDELRRELIHHGAPASLVDGAERARRDEERHAAIMRRMARRFGGHAPRARVDHRAPRSLELIARDNAVEGCVRETFGALVGMWQASRARDRHIRVVMRAVARDEANHAALSWEIDRWARSRLSPAAIARLDRARDEALRQLREESADDPPRELVTRSGLPSGRDHRVLVDRFVSAIAPA